MNANITKTQIFHKINYKEWPKRPPLYKTIFMLKILVAPSFMKLY